MSGWIAAAASQKQRRLNRGERRDDALVLFVIGAIMLVICAFYFLVIR